MSTLKATNIKNESSASNNIVLDSGGGVVVSGVTTFSSAVNFSGSGDITLGTGTTISSPASDTFTVSTSGSERVRIDSSGRLAIGTTSPVAPLHVSGAELRLQNDTKFEIGFRGSSASTSLAFRDAFAGTDRMTIDSSGRLLVGTSSATGDFGAVVNAGGTARVLLSRESLPTSAGGLGNLGWGRNNGEVGATIGGVADANWTSGSSYPTRLVFSTTANGASFPTERMRITNDGRILQGSIIASGGAGYNTTNSGLEIGSGVISHQIANNTSSGAYFSAFFRGSSPIGSIRQSGTTGVSFNTTSDYRLKENIIGISDAVNRVKLLKPCKFNFIAEPDRVVDGFIAHEAQAIVPECVTGEKDAVDADGQPIYQGIDQSKLVPLLTAALQEALEEIETLKAQNAAILARLDAAGI